VGKLEFFHQPLLPDVVLNMPDEAQGALISAPVISTEGTPECSVCLMRRKAHVEAQKRWLAARALRLENAAHDDLNSFISRALRLETRRPEFFHQPLLPDVVLMRRKAHVEAQKRWLAARALRLENAAHDDLNSFISRFCQMWS
jgi:hypothetical protein